ncbi:response regulator transcription factor [Nocardioides scoriae]|uniref:response regulator transcription factor n=1 Tax=Nocardioides scoriae TaxID=642780 RepID=UPI0018D4C93E|nr:LuxR C-terminal-related transcriptional regulator [Nocardioides scoriae]
MSLEDRLRACLDGEALELPTLAGEVYAAVARHVPYDFACLATTDPASGVVTWASKTRDLGIGDEEFAAAEYGSATDINKFEDIARRQPPVGAIHLDTGGHPELSYRHREFMQRRFGFTDELRAAFVSRGACWGALGLARAAGDPPYTQDDLDQVATICDLVAGAIQRSLFRHGTAADPVPVPSGPSVLIVDPTNRLTQATPAARAAIQDLGGFDHGSLPASVLAVIATTRLRGEPFQSRTQLEDGRWLTLCAAPLAGSTGGSADIVVTLERTPRSVLSRLALTAHGLTSREEDVALLVLQGVDTRGIAQSLHMSPHTVQDHLKAIFTKLRVGSRREMTARLTLD